MDYKKIQNGRVMTITKDLCRFLETCGKLDSSKMAAFIG